MTPKLWIPVYHDTRDQRVIEWANKNFGTHDLNGRPKPDLRANETGFKHLISNIKTNKKWWQVWR